MDQNYVREKLKEVQNVRHSIQRSIGGLEQSGVEYPNIDLRVAAIMDVFTYHSFNPEFLICQLTPNDWENELHSFQPNLFFLESAWLGKDGLWHSKVSHLSDELIGIINYCKKHDIPVVLWNKEDPVHFNTFLAVAKYADYVFTTDIDCIVRYKRILKHDHVYLLPFAAQSKKHNPIECYQRENSFCFAGTYYKRYPERNKDLETIINVTKDVSSVVIYDRNYQKRDSNHMFPVRYKRYIKGMLPPDEIDKAYKGHRYNINMNTVKRSQSMCARRVFELLASNTITISNYSLAVRNLLGDLVICTDDGERLKTELLKFENEEYYYKYRLAGLRKVLTEHTYSNRVRYILKKVYRQEIAINWGEIAVIAIANNELEFNHILRSYTKQSYKNKQLFIITSLKKQPSTSVSIVSHPTAEWMEGIQSKFDYIACFSIHDYYGENYLFDFMTTREYLDINVVTKRMYFENHDGILSKRGSGVTYQSTDSGALRRSLVKCGIYDSTKWLRLIQSIDTSVIESESFSIDEFNYCMNYLGSNCERVDDLAIPDTGISMDLLYQKAEQIRVSRCFDTPELNNSISNEMSPGVICKSNAILITNSSDSVNANIQSRLIEYKQLGMLVDVYQCNELYMNRQFDYVGIDIVTGNYECLVNILTYGGHNTILIHRLTQSLWASIRKVTMGKRLIVRIHESDMQAPWKRSDRDFWREIFNLAVDSKKYQLHFIFVSTHAALQVFKNLEEDLPNHLYSISHNYIVSDLLNTK